MHILIWKSSLDKLDFCLQTVFLLYLKLTVSFLWQGTIVVEVFSTFCICCGFEVGTENTVSESLLHITYRPHGA